jgi:hypothetical protein
MPLAPRQGKLSIFSGDMAELFRFTECEVSDSRPICSLVCDSKHVTIRISEKSPRIPSQFWNKLVPHKIRHDILTFECLSCALRRCSMHYHPPRM